MTKNALKDNNLLINVLNKSLSLSQLNLRHWDMILRQARQSHVISILANRLSKDELNCLPDRVKLHFEIQNQVSIRHLSAINWEIQCILDALKTVNQPLVLLKGAAYAISDLPVSRGRLFSDVDILVPFNQIEKVEKAFVKFGWVSTKLEAYDQMYYRKWMHELPPMTHEKRGTALDVHHNILPLTAKKPVDSSKLLSEKVPISGYENVYVLQPVDMVLHSMTHLFHEGEMDHGLRDLLDLDSLINYFSHKEKNFWDKLLQRSEELNLQLPLYYGLRYPHKILKTPVPNDVLTKTNKFLPKFPRLMDFIFTRGFRPNHRSCDDSYSVFAKWLIYVRSHYLRMPFYLLIPHLIRKAYVRRTAKIESEANNQQQA